MPEEYPRVWETVGAMPAGWELQRSLIRVENHPMKRTDRLPMLLGGALSLLLSSAGVLAAGESCPDMSAAMDIEDVALPAMSTTYHGDQAFPEVARDGVDANLQADTQRLLNAELMSRESAVPATTAIRIALPAADLDAISSKTLDTTSRRVQIGVEQQVSRTIRFAASVMSTRGGSPEIAVAGEFNGQRVWAAPVQSAGATALRLRFADVQLGEGAQLYVYNTAGDAFGPYADDMVSDAGDFWSNIVSGEELRVQLVAPTRESLMATSFTIADVAHIGPRFQVKAPKSEPGLKAFCAFNGSCITNAKCVLDTYWSNIELLRRATAHYVFQVDGGSYICSGGLLNDSVPKTTVPYFLTANHCISTMAEANSIEAYWQFTAPCGGNCYNAEGNVTSTLGATLLKTSYKQDFAFLRLKQMPPASSVYLGWTADPVAHSHGTSLFRVSHPKGAPQAFSRHSVDRQAGTCDGIPRGSFIYSRDVRAGTEGGSSGAVVTNANAQVVGQLLGACGLDPENGCNVAVNATVDGAFAAYYSQVKPWLNP